MAPATWVDAAREAWRSMTGGDMGERSQQQFSLGDAVRDGMRQAEDAALAGERRIRRAASDDRERAVLWVAAATLGVQLGWRVLPQRFMVRHFTSSWRALRGGRVWTLLTANLSHNGGWHLASNGLVVCVLGPAVVRECRSDERFLEVYGLSGATGMLASAMWKGARGRPLDATVGASGAAMGIFGAHLVLRPEDRILFGMPLTAGQLALLVAAGDVACAWAMRPHVALACHAGGALAGATYAAAMRGRIRWEEERAMGWRGVIGKADETPLLATLVWRRVVDGPARG